MQQFGSFDWTHLSDQVDGVERLLKQIFGDSIELEELHAGNEEVDKLKTAIETITSPHYQVVEYAEVDPFQPFLEADALGLGKLKSDLDNNIEYDEDDYSEVIQKTVILVAFIINMTNEGAKPIEIQDKIAIFLARLFEYLRLKS